MRIKIFSLIVSALLMGSSVLAQDTTIHSDGLTVNGTIESTSGGIIFPDGSIQSSANVSLKVSDNNMNYLGLFVDHFNGSSGGGFIIYSTESQEMIPISYETGEVVGTSIYFPGSSCSGTPYLSAVEGYLIVYNNGLYYTGTGVAPTSITTSSFRTYDGACVNTGYTHYTVPAMTVTPTLSLPVALPLNLLH